LATRRWENNNKTDLQELEWGHGLNWYGSGEGQVVGWIDMAQERDKWWAGLIRLRRGTGGGLV
jgi:hypothetical protein